MPPSAAGVAGGADAAALAGAPHGNPVLEGSVRRDRSTVRVTAQLLDAADGYHIWSETYDAAGGGTGHGAG